MTQSTRRPMRERKRLSTFLAQKRATDDRNARRRTSQPLAPAGPVGRVFLPEKHHLSPAECRIAEARLAEAERTRPFAGTAQRIKFMRALRIAGIVSSIRGGRVGNRRWSKHMLGKRGGLALARHGLHHLRTIAPLGYQAMMQSRGRKQAQEVWETTGQVLTIGAQPTETMEQQRLRALNELWETAQWQTQRDFLSW